MTTPFLSRRADDEPSTTEDVLAIRTSCDALDRVQSLVVKDYVRTRLENGEDAEETRIAYAALLYISNLGISEKIRHYEADITRAEAYREQVKRGPAHGPTHGHNH